MKYAGEEVEDQEGRVADPEAKGQLLIFFDIITTKYSSIDFDLYIKHNF